VLVLVWAWVGRQGRGKLREPPPSLWIRNFTTFAPTAVLRSCTDVTLCANEAPSLHCASSATATATATATTTATTTSATGNLNGIGSTGTGTTATASATAFWQPL
jgi:hypothetical protein